MASFDVGDILIAGPRYFGCYRSAAERVKVVDSGRGPYYGISWSDTEVYCLARNGNRGELIMVFDESFELKRVMQLGRPIDGHQILLHGDQLLVTATSENSILSFDLRTDRIRPWNWTNQTNDVNHINGLFIHPCGKTEVSQDNKKGNYSEVVTFSEPFGYELGRRIIGSVDQGTHNIEGEMIVASGDVSSLFLDSNGACKEVYRNAGFFRGLARAANQLGEEVVLLGRSEIKMRHERGLELPCVITALLRDGFQEIGELVIPDLGQIYEIRTTDPEYSHNGITVPLAD